MIKLVKLAFVWATALVLLAFTASSQSVPRQALHGHVPAVLSRLNPTGRLAATNRLQLAIGLPLRNTNELAALLDQIYSNPANPNYRHYLAPAEFTQRFGPTEEDYEKVVAFARANGFTVRGTYSNRMLVDVEASVADVERTFQVTLRTYPHPREKRNFFAPDVEPSLDLATPVLHIGGLDNFVVPRPLSHLKPLAANAAEATPQSGSGPSGAYVGNDFRAAYVPGVTLTGAGQTVGLLEFAGYYPSDITNYEKDYGVSNVPLANVLLNGVSNITNNGDEGEPPLDIEMAISMAPGLAQLRVYYGTSGDTIMNQIATDDLAKQISASWEYGIDSTTLQIFQQLAAQGQSYFNSSGDSDADTGSPNQPTDVPYVTSVGGTELNTTGPGGSWVSESVWNWGGGVGSAGGISTTYAIPAWQQGINMANNQGSTTMRNLPDVAMCADNVEVQYGDGSSGNFGGTSCASPLWAGFTALVNQQAATNNYPTVGFINPAIYAIGKGTGYASAFHDITSGNNTSSSSPTAFYALPGYDLCTGWGTPFGQGMINALAMAGPSRAGAITWGAATTVSGDTDVATLGTALYACDWANNNQAVNGVTFTGSTSTSDGGTNVGLSGFTSNYGGFTASSNPYNALSTAYKNILAGGDYNGGNATATVTLENLIAGRVYAVQVWVEDARSYGEGRTEVLDGNSGSSTTTLAYNSTDAVGGVGQYAIGIFTASGTSETFTLLASASTQLNALQVRDVTACAWNYWAGYVNGSWDGTTTNWGNGQSFSVASALYNNVNFADTNFFGAVVANNVISIQSAGVSSGTVNFANNSVNYTVQNAGGVTGITGSTAVTMSGAGTVTFAGTNTYTGSTTINAGALVLSGNGSLAGSSQLVLNGGVFNVSALSGFTVTGSQPVTFGGGLLLANSLTLNGAAFTNSVVNQTAPFIIATNLTYGATASAITISALPGFVSYPVQFPLIEYVAGASGSFNLNMLNLPARYAGYLSNDVANSSVDLVLTSGGGLVVPLAWEGNVNGNWDVLVTTNWVNGTNAAAAQLYANNSSVIFNDSATGATNVSLQSTLLPASVVVSNNILNYIFTGAGQLGGSMSLTKSGTGMLAISTANSYTGGTTIRAGTLQVNAAAGAGAGTVADGGIFNVNIGANILNNAVTGAGTINVLAAASAETDLGGSLAGFTGSLNVPASNGSSQVGITNGAVNLNGNATVNIAGGGTLYLSGSAISAPVNVSGGGNSRNLGALRVDNDAAVTGPVTLQGNAAFGVYTSLGIISGVISDGGHGYSLQLDGSGILMLSGINTYSGGTILNGGTVAAKNAGVFGSGLVTVTNSSTLLGYGSTLTNPVMLASGQTLTLSSPSTITLAGQISGPGNLTASGSTCVLSGAKTYTGLTAISGGTLSLSGGNNMLPTNTLVSFSGSGTLNLGTGSQTVSNLTVADGVTGTLTNGGTLIINDPVNFRVGNTNSAGTAVLNLSGLSSFNYTNPGGIFDVGGQYTGSGSVSAYGNLYLAKASAITASQFGIGDNGSSYGGTSYCTGTVWMAQSTTINANTLKLGITGSRGSPAGFLQFQTGVTNPALTLRAADGVSPVPNPIVLGEISDSSYPIYALGTIDLMTGITGTSTLNASVSELIIGQHNYDANQNSPAEGSFLMGGGTLNATTIIIGQKTSASTGLGGANGTFSLNGGTVTVGTITLGDRQGATNVTGTFNLNSGVVQAQTIQPGASTATRVFNWNGGTITNYNGSTGLTIASGLTLTLGGSGSPTFGVGPLLTATVNAVLAGTNGLTLTGSGTLVLNATNNYTGTTIVSQGILQVNGALGTNTLLVASGATLAGLGRVNGATTVQSGGLLSPGDAGGPGRLTVSNSLTLYSGSTNLLVVDNNGGVLTNSQVSVTGTLTLGGTLTIINGGASPLAAGNSFTLYNAGVFNSAFSNLTLPALATNLVWDTSQLANSGVITVASIPVITNQPQSLTVNSGNPASLGVGATGSGTLAYQWQQNGANLAGATTDVYSLAAAQPVDAGNYTVIITNNYGSVTSQVATLTVNLAPAISTPPQNVTVYVNSNATFNVIAGGMPAPAYQWSFNGTNISGATAANYIVMAAQPANEGNYTVVITNVAGCITSSVASLSLYREFGCAPAPYPSLLASNGARHLLVPGFQLGSISVSSLASTDARTNTTGQDGVVFTTAWQVGQTAALQVVASAAGGYLNGWVDWNTNGSWSDAGDQVFTNTVLAAGTNTLMFTVPTGAAIGTNGWARFRFSSLTNLNFTGEAPDGEVEDYPVTVSGLALTYLAGTNGTISGAATQTVSYAGSGSAVTAVPNSGYVFTNWSDGLTVNPRTDTDVTTNLTVTACFVTAPAPQIVPGGLSVVANGLQLVFSGSNGQPYRVLGSTNLLLPVSDWIVLTNGTFGAGPATFTDGTATNPAGFYLIVSP